MLYAAPTAQGSGDYSSWANACTLQTALAQAQSGDEIWVKAGVHYPGAAGNRTATFALKNGVALYGGFAGMETLRDQRDWQANPTILSGDIDQNDNHGGDYINENTSQIVGNNAYPIITANGVDDTTVLDGFIITAGQANESSWPNNSGAGMYNDAASPIVRNTTFSGNFADWDGGGMKNASNSNPTLTTVTFSGNAARFGGGMENSLGSGPTLTDVTFVGNNAADSGGGMYNYDECSPMLVNVVFSGNSAAYAGGGMYNWWYSNPMLVNVIFSNNSAYFYGGGISNVWGSSPMRVNVTLNGNSAQDGGGIYNNLYSSNPTMTRSHFKNV